jgi:hypothetical protein
VAIHTGGREHLVGATLSAMARRLDPACFLGRCVMHPWIARSVPSRPRAVPGALAERQEGPLPRLSATTCTSIALSRIDRDA